MASLFVPERLLNKVQAKRILAGLMLSVASLWFCLSFCFHLVADCTCILTRISTVTCCFLALLLIIFLCEFEGLRINKNKSVEVWWNLERVSYFCSLARTNGIPSSSIGFNSLAFFSSLRIDFSIFLFFFSSRALTIAGSIFFFFLRGSALKDKSKQDYSTPMKVFLAKSGENRKKAGSHTENTR